MSSEPKWKADLLDLRRHMRGSRTRLQTGLSMCRVALTNHAGTMSEESERVLRSQIREWEREATLLDEGLWELEAILDDPSSTVADAVPVIERNLLRAEARFEGLEDIGGETS